MSSLGRPFTLLAVAMLLAGGAFSAQAEPFRLIVTDLEAPLVPNSVMDLALNLGYFEREGVEVELVRVQQTPSALAALQSGEGEMANVGVDALLQFVARGADDLRAVASPNKSLPFLIAANTDVATTADLPGRSFAVGRLGSLDHSLSRMVLAADDVDLDALELVGLGQPNIRAQALAAGQIDATTMSIGVWLSLPDKEGLHVLVSQEDYYAAAPVVNKVNIVSTETLEQRRDDVVAVVAALVQISRDIAADPQIWIDGMTEARPDVDPADLENLAATFADSWSVNGGMNAEELTYTTDWLYEGEDYVGLDPVELGQWADFSILDDVLARLGTATDLDQPGR